MGMEAPPTTDAAVAVATVRPDHRPKPRRVTFVADTDTDNSAIAPFPPATAVAAGACSKLESSSSNDERILYAANSSNNNARQSEERPLLLPPPCSAPAKPVAVIDLTGDGNGLD